MLAFSRPFWPLFLHVLGAMTTFGAVVHRRPLVGRRLEAARTGVPAPRDVPDTAGDDPVLRAPARVRPDHVQPREGRFRRQRPDLGRPRIHGFADLGALILLITIGLAFWWMRSGKAVAGRIATGTSSILLVLLTVAMLAMSGKWG